MTAKRIIMSALLGSIAAMAFAVPAQAATAEAVCTIEGSATANVQWVGNGTTSTYSFGPTGLGISCVFAVAGPGKVPEAGVATVTALSAGSFDNIVCGTGTAADPQPTVTQVAATPKAQGLLLNADLGYHIVFAGGEGALTWGDNASPGVPDANTAPSSTAPVGGGFINISPWRGAGHPLGSQGGIFPGDPVSEGGLCTNGFNVEGVVSGTLAG